MEKKEKRTRLTEKKRRELILVYVTKLGENPPTLKGFKNYLEGFGWFKKLSVVAKNNRAQRYFHEVKEMCGEVKETEEKSTTVSESKKKCSTETIRKFYLIIKRASESRVGISKRDIEMIMGYKTPMSTKSVDNLNEYICRETGFKPLSLAESPFVDYDIIKVDYDTAILILEDLRERLKGSEPAMPAEYEDFESKVKAIIRRDYFALLLFKKNNTIQNTTGDIQQFKEFVVGKKKSAYMGYDKICEVFKSNLEKRYKLSKNGIDIKFSSRFRKHITVLDTSGNPEIRKALDRIASVYAEYFCENIVESEKKILEDNTTLREKSRLEMIETLFFKNKSGEMFLSDLWKKFDETDTPRGWDLLGLLRKYPEKFRIERFANKSNGGYSEDKIIYTAPKEEESEVDQLEEAAQEEEIQKDIKPNPETINDNVVEVKDKGTKKRILEAIVGFKDYSEKPSAFLNPGEVMMFDTYYYMYKIEVDLDDKNSIFEFLKLYWTTGGKTILCNGKLCDIEHELRELLVG